MRARNVVSPINRTRNHVVLFESPPAWGDRWSICEAEISEDGADPWEKALGIRRDGDRNDDNDKGFPSSSGKAVWFWIPTDLVPFFYGFILPQLKERKKGERHHRDLVQKIDDLIARLTPSKTPANPGQGKMPTGPLIKIG